MPITLPCRRCGAQLPVPVDDAPVHPESKSREYPMNCGCGERTPVTWFRGPNALTNWRAHSIFRERRFQVR
jgi:hypothetical protein